MSTRTLITAVAFTLSLGALATAAGEDARLGAWELEIVHAGGPVPAKLFLASGATGHFECRGKRFELSRLVLTDSNLSFDLGGPASSFSGTLSAEALEGTFSTPFEDCPCRGWRPGAKPKPGWEVLVGAWEMSSELGGREIPATLTLALGADGAIEGSWDSMGGEMELSELAFDGETLSFARAMGGGLMEFEGQVAGDEIDGRHVAGMGEIPCSGRRADGAAAPEELPAWATATTDEEYFDALEADFDAEAFRAVPRDGFDVLDAPEMVRGDEALDVDLDEPVLGIALNGEAKAYPIHALNASELANDTCGGVPIAASW